MRKAALLALLLAPLCLWGGSYKANSLGQNIEALEGPSRYTVVDAPPESAVMPPVFGLERDGFTPSSRTLLRDGEPWKRLDSFFKGPLRVDAVWDSGRESLESVVCHEDGRLTYRGDGQTSTSLLYDAEGRLVQALRREGEALKETDLLYRTPDGNLAMVRTVAVEVADVLVSDAFLLEDGRLITDEAVLDLQEEAATARKEDGNLVLTSVSPGGVSTETTLDAKGQVVRIVRRSGSAVLSTEERTWTEDGILAGSTRVEGTSAVVSEFRGGALWRETCREDGELAYTNVYEDGERRQTLYEYGAPYALVVYDSLTGKIKKVEYL